MIRTILLVSKDVLPHLSNRLVQKFIENNLKKGKRTSNPEDNRAIDLASPPFEIEGLVDLPITFGKATTKITSLDLTQQPRR